MNTRRQDRFDPRTTLRNDKTHQLDFPGPNGSQHRLETIFAQDLESFVIDSQVPRRVRIDRSRDASRAERTAVPSPSPRATAKTASASAARCPQKMTSRTSDDGARSYREVVTGPNLPRLNIQRDKSQHANPRGRDSCKGDRDYVEFSSCFQGSLQLQIQRRKQLFLRAEAAARAPASEALSRTCSDGSFTSFKSPRELTRCLPLRPPQPNRSIDPHGDQFFPVNASGPSSLPVPRSIDFQRTVSHPMGIGVETEFLLKARKPRDRANSLEDFAEGVAENHNRDLVHADPTHMVNNVGRYPGLMEYNMWTLIDDSILHKGQAWGMEMISPLFVAFPGSRWRSYVEATWKSLERSYDISSSPECGTHIHISVAKGYSLRELKRIGQTIIHFEPAINALVPNHRIAPLCHFAKSNWLDSDELAQKGRLRAESVNFISKITCFHDFLEVMQPDEDRHYAWNFRAYERYRTIEFRQPPGSRSVQEILSWTELVMSVVQSGIRHGTPEKLIRVPPTVGGLRWFLEQSFVQGVNEPRHLDRLWSLASPGAFTHAKAMARVRSDEHQEQVKKTIEEDSKRIAQASRRKTPYWD